MTLAQDHRKTVEKYTAWRTRAPTYKWAKTYYDDLVPYRGAAGDVRRPAGWTRRRGYTREVGLLENGAVQFYYYGEPSVRFEPDGRIVVRTRRYNYGHCNDVAALTSGAVYVQPIVGVVQFRCQATENNGRWRWYSAYNIVQYDWASDDLVFKNAHKDSNDWWYLEYVQGGLATDLYELDRAKAKALVTEYRLSEFETAMRMALTLDRAMLEQMEKTYAGVDYDRVLEHCARGEFFDALNYTPRCAAQVFGHRHWRAEERITPQSFKRIREYLYMYHGAYTTRRKYAVKLSQYARTRRLGRL